jgi:hypothetical protein
VDNAVQRMVRTLDVKTAHAQNDRHVVRCGACEVTGKWYTADESALMALHNDAVINIGSPPDRRKQGRSLLHS